MDIDSSDTLASEPQHFWLQLDKRHKTVLVINFVGFVIVLTSLCLLILLLTIVMIYDHKIETTTHLNAISIAKSTSIKDNEIDFKLRLITRNDWMAKPSKTRLIDLKLPVNRIFVTHTDTIGCSLDSDCVHIVQDIQDQHLQKRDDIGWNFLIGGDGNVYEGRGWNKRGAHTKGYNSGTIAIAFIGSFSRFSPVNVQFYALRALLQNGIELEKIYDNYLIYPQRAFSSTTDSPGDNVIDVIKEWPHYKDL